MQYGLYTIWVKNPYIDRKKVLENFPKFIPQERRLFFQCQSTFQMTMRFITKMISIKIVKILEFTPKKRKLSFMFFFKTWLMKFFSEKPGK